MHYYKHVRELSKCRKEPGGQLCGRLSRMCGVSPVGHTEECVFATRDRYKVPRFTTTTTVLLDRRVVGRRCAGLFYWDIGETKSASGIQAYGEVLTEVDDVYEKYKKETDLSQRKRLQNHLQRALISSQELGDEKLHVVTQMMELVENRARQMEAHSQCFQEPQEVEKPVEKAKPEAVLPERPSTRRIRRQRNSESHESCHIANGVVVVEEAGEEQPPKEKKSKSAKKKKRSKAKQEREVSPVEFAIDPNEPTYCLCNQVSYGEMIGCDNEQCPIEWFHFSCVGLTYKPKGKWYCPKCRGDSEKTMDKSIEKTKKDRRSR